MFLMTRLLLSLKVRDGDIRRTAGKMLSTVQQIYQNTKANVICEEDPESTFWPKWSTETGLIAYLTV